MTTLQGMLAMTIHEDRVRAYGHPARRHSAEARLAAVSRRGRRGRGILGRLVGRIRIPLSGEPALSTTRP
ncbi:MAG: hypothetical protein MUE82_04380 [Chloroflexi bacterium]|jgi:hypothetical protein|nr:hypothetical protein [Chloroflexota bacterium]